MGLGLLVALVWAGPVEDRALISQLDREVIALKQRLAIVQSSLATCSVETAPDPLYAELLSVLAGLPATVERQGRDTTVTVPVDTLFSAGSLGMREEAEPVLDLLAIALKIHVDVDVAVVVFLDNGTPNPKLVKQFPTAWELSAARSAAVVREFTEGFGVSPSRMTASGRGDQLPISSNDTVEGRATNRRVVFVLSRRPSLSPGSAP